MGENKKKIVIVGGGIAGLSAGIYGRLAGYEVDIYEKNPVAGGECMGWNRRGCHIDNCIHWLTGTKPGTGLRRVWETVGALEESTEFADCDIFYTSIAGGTQVTLWKDLEKTQAELLKISPEDEIEIKKFVGFYGGYAKGDEGIWLHGFKGFGRGVQTSGIESPVYRLSARRLCCKFFPCVLCHHCIR